MRSKEEVLQLIAELEADYETIADLFQKNMLMTQKIELIEPDEFDWAGLGYPIHNLYTAFENYFLRIAKFFKNYLDKAEWHRSFLLRMTLHIESIRPAIISKDLFRELDELRGFRHVFRYMYQYELDPDKMRLVNARIPRVRALFPAEHQNFIAYLRQLADSVESL
ncbi:hypothetical protein U27_01343 [Candidatus Vecturithrix granuli]|uniref:HepT-like domain-containing protein n=1 Tax=Vecturithrix granuli TaxID=1499967 RepID=A0A081CA38_VECG1|nr:hypothetical protein U27_01343 [Candidatus Vecturithrix granuli]